MLPAKKDIIDRLRKEIILREDRGAATFSHPLNENGHKGALQYIEACFPNAVFPKAAIHEVLQVGADDHAAAYGFTAALLGTFLQGTALWVSTGQAIFPPALSRFRLDASRIIFIHLYRDKEVLWVMEEALKCRGLSAVVGEVKQITFMQSRRLQLAAEAGKVTGFIFRQPATASPTVQQNTSGAASHAVQSSACIARWHIKSLPSRLQAGMPGVGFPCWDIELSRIRNGKPGRWQMQWKVDHFVYLQDEAVYEEGLLQKVG